MNFTTNDLYLSLGIVVGLSLGKKYIEPIISSTLGA